MFRYGMINSRGSYVLLFAAMALPFTTSAQTPTPSKAPMTSKEEISYLLGRNIAEGFQRQGVDVDPKIFQSSFEGALKGEPSKYSSAEGQKLLQQFSTQMAEKQKVAMAGAAVVNEKEGAAFLEGNAKAAGVKVLPSGLQYKVLTEGKGDKSPALTDTVVAHYRGTLLSGKEFDSSYARGEPATFPVNGLIKGWQEALQLMKPGDKWELSVPANLAYGERGAGNDIGANATLKFVIELISIK